MIMSVVFDHVDIHVSDLAASRAFFGEALGLPTNDGELVEWGDFGITGVSDEHPLTSRLHIAFGAEDRDAVDAWWNRLTEAGYESDGEPGPRPQYSESYYGGFILDPAGNSWKPCTTTASARVRSTISGCARATSPLRNASTRPSRRS